MEVEDDILSEVIECKEYHKRTPEFGERAWTAEGKEFVVVYWDVGNGWCDIMAIIPKKDKDLRSGIGKFYKKLRKAIMEHYDEDMCRID